MVKKIMTVYEKYEEGIKATIYLVVAVIATILTAGMC